MRDQPGSGVVWIIQCGSPCEGRPAGRCDRRGLFVVGVVYYCAGYMRWKFTNWPVRLAFVTLALAVVLNTALEEF
jgi:hypothetical protein